MSKPLVEFLKLLVEEMYGNVPAFLFVTILENERLNIMQIGLRSNIPVSEIYPALSLLVQHLLVLYDISLADGITYYSADITTAWDLIRMSNYAHLVDSTLGSNVSALIGNVHYYGSVCADQILEKEEVDIKPIQLPKRMTKAEYAKAVAERAKMKTFERPTPKEDEFLHPSIGHRREMDTALQNAFDGGLIVRAKPRDFLSELDFNQKIAWSVKKEKIEDLNEDKLAPSEKKFIKESIESRNTMLKSVEHGNLKMVENPQEFYNTEQSRKRKREVEEEEDYRQKKHLYLKLILRRRLLEQRDLQLEQEMIEKEKQKNQQSWIDRAKNVITKSKDQPKHQSGLLEDNVGGGFFYMSYRYPAHFNHFLRLDSRQKRHAFKTTQTLQKRKLGGDTPSLQNENKRQKVGKKASESKSEQIAMKGHQEMNQFQGEIKQARANRATYIDGSKTDEERSELQNHEERNSAQHENGGPAQEPYEPDIDVDNKGKTAQHENFLQESLRPDTNNNALKLSAGGESESSGSIRDFNGSKESEDVPDLIQNDQHPEIQHNAKNDNQIPSNQGLNGDINEAYLQVQTQKETIEGNGVNGEQGNGVLREEGGVTKSHNLLHTPTFIPRPFRYQKEVDDEGRVCTVWRDKRHKIQWEYEESKMKKARKFGISLKEYDANSGRHAIHPAARSFYCPESRPGDISALSIDEAERYSSTVDYFRILVLSYGDFLDDPKPTAMEELEKWWEVDKRWYTLITDEIWRQEIMRVRGQTPPDNAEATSYLEDYLYHNLEGNEDPNGTDASSNIADGGEGDVLSTGDSQGQNGVADDGERTQMDAETTPCVDENLWGPEEADDHREKVDSTHEIADEDVKNSSDMQTTVMQGSKGSTKRKRGEATRRLTSKPNSTTKTKDKLTAKRKTEREVKAPKSKRSKPKKASYISEPDGHLSEDSQYDDLEDVESNEIYDSNGEIVKKRNRRRVVESDTESESGPEPEADENVDSEVDHAEEEGGDEDGGEGEGEGDGEDEEEEEEEEEEEAEEAEDEEGEVDAEDEQGGEAGNENEGDNEHEPKKKRRRTKTDENLVPRRRKKRKRKLTARIQNYHQKDVIEKWQYDDEDVYERVEQLWDDGGIPYFRLNHQELRLSLRTHHLANYVAQFHGLTHEKVFKAILRALQKKQNKCEAARGVANPNLRPDARSVGREEDEDISLPMLKGYEKEHWQFPYVFIEEIEQELDANFEFTGSNPMIGEMVTQAAKAIKSEDDKSPAVIKTEDKDDDPASLLKDDESKGLIPDAVGVEEVDDDAVEQSQVKPVSAEEKSPSADEVADEEGAVNSDEEKKVDPDVHVNDPKPKQKAGSKLKKSENQGKDKKPLEDSRTQHRYREITTVVQSLLEKHHLAQVFNTFLLNDDKSEQKPRKCFVKKKPEPPSDGEAEENNENKSQENMESDMDDPDIELEEWEWIDGVKKPQLLENDVEDPDESKRKARYQDILWNFRKEPFFIRDEAGKRHHPPPNMEGRVHYSVDFVWVSQGLIREKILEQINQQYGRDAYVISCVLIERGALTEKDIKLFSMLNERDVNHIILNLFEGGFLTSQEIPKDSRREPENTIYLWRFDLERARVNVLNRAYKAMARILQRLNHEKEKNKVVLERESRREFEKKSMNVVLRPDEKERLKKFHEMEEKVFSMLIRLDELVSVMRDMVTSLNV